MGKDHLKVAWILLGLYVTLVHGQRTVQNLLLPSEAYSEGECISPQAVQVDIAWITQQKVFYVPLASQFAIHRFSETLLSRPSASEEELNTMCLTIEASQGGAALNFTTVGYDDREFRQTCAPGSGPGLINCFAVGSSAGVNPSKTRAAGLFMVAWDNRSYLILVRCVDGYFRDFVVLSTRPTVSHDVFSSVLNVTRHLGFDERRIQSIPYDNCIRSSAGVILHQHQHQRRRNELIHVSQLTAPFAGDGRFPSSPSLIRHQHQVVQVINNAQIQQASSVPNNGNADDQNAQQQLQQVVNQVQVPGLHHPQQFPFGLGPGGHGVIPGQGYGPPFGPFLNGFPSPGGPFG